jgi:colicin import membrane protein
MVAPRAQPPAAEAREAAEAAVERLQEQLLEAMARARVQEARAAEAESSALQAEEQLEALARSQLDESMRLREQVSNLREQLRNAEARAQAQAQTIENERRQRSLEPRPVRAPNLLHLAEVELTPRPAKTGRANLVLSGLLASTLSFGGAAYFMFYSPLQKQTVALEQQRTQDSQEHAQALTNLRAQSDAERRGLEAQNAELRAQLEKARSEALAMGPAADEPRRGARAARDRNLTDAADASDNSPSATRSARAIERRMRRRAAQQEGDAAGDSAESSPAPAAKPRPAASRSAPDNGDDPLGGL